MPSFLDQSIKQVGPNSWYVGALVCERIQTMQPEDTVAAWADDDCTYILRQPRDSDVASPPVMEISDPIKLVHEGGTLSRVWTIGRHVFCKVKAWDNAREPEELTINFVKKIAPQITTPEVVHGWTEGDRSFLLVRRIEGSTLRDAWESLSPSQRTSAVKTVAMYCSLLAQNTSQTLRTPTGKAVDEPYLAPPNSKLLGPLTIEEFRTYISASSAGCSALGDEFYFYHADLGPGNIIVSDGGSIAGIPDWESAGYYPRFWIASKPAVSSGFDFCPSVAGFVDHEWRKCLRTELETCGFLSAGLWYMEWSSRSEEFGSQA